MTNRYEIPKILNLLSSRFDDTKPASQPPDPQRRKIHKSHQTIDYSDLDYTPQRKSSDDSLNSQQSFESQHSSDSHSSVTVREQRKQDSPALGKQWSSTSTTSETMSEGGATQSAPPVMGEKAYDSFVLEDYSKPPLTRTQAINPAVRRDFRYNDGKYLR